MSLSLERMLGGLALLVVSSGCWWGFTGADSEWGSFGLANAGVVSGLVGAALLLFARRENAGTVEDARV